MIAVTVINPFHVEVHIPDGESYTEAEEQAAIVAALRKYAETAEGPMKEWAGAVAANSTLA